MTRQEFEAWVSKNGRAIYVRPPYDLEPCLCGDVNCHGWKFVERQDVPAVRDLTYEMVHG